MKSKIIRASGLIALLLIAAVASTPIMMTTAPMSLFVDTNLGTDSGRCTGTGTAACKTIQAACDLAPWLVRHPVTITLADGVYNGGCSLRGHQYAAADLTLGAWIQITGNFSTVTPTTGSATGNVTSFSAASAGPNGKAVITVAAAGWTVSDFSGKFLEFTGGTCSGAVNTIYDNDATTITLAANAIIVGQTSNACTPDATTTFAVRDVGASVTRTVFTPKKGPSNIAQPTNFAAGFSAMFVIDGNGASAGRPNGFASSFSSGSVYITRILFNGGSTRPTILADNSQGVVIAQNRFAAGSASMNFYRSSGTVAYNTAALNTGGQYFIIADSADRDSTTTDITIASNVINPGALLISTSGSASTLITRTNSVRGSTNVAVSIKTAQVYEDFQNYYEPASGGCMQLGVGGNASNYGSGSAEILSLYCSGYTAGPGLSIMGKWVIQGQNSGQPWTIAGGAGSISAISPSGGAIVMYPSGSTITCNNGGVNCITLSAPHPEDYFSDANLTTANHMMTNVDGSCISNNSNSSCNITNVGPWITYPSGNIAEGSMFMLGHRQTANLPASSTANGALTSGGMFYDTTTNTLKYNDGTQWNGVPAFLPVGSAQQAERASNGTASAGGVLTVSFSPNFGAAPHCICVDTNATPTSCGISTAATISAVTFTLGVARADVIEYWCVGQK